MKQYFLPLPVILILVILGGCQTPPSPKEETGDENTDTVEISTMDLWLLNSFPQRGEFRLAALAPRFQFPDEERAYARANAARQLSIFTGGARVRFARVMDQNIIGTVQDQLVEVLYDRDLAQSFGESMTIEKEIREADSYMALISQESTEVPSFPVESLVPGSKPSWITNLPRHEGYIYGVGVSGRRKTLFESSFQADNQAMAEIAAFVETNVFSGIANIERSGESYGESGSSVKTLTWSDVYIEGMMIISRWREPDNSSFYSLAVARKPE